MPKELGDPVPPTILGRLTASRKALAMVDAALALGFFDQVQGEVFSIRSVSEEFGMSLRAAEALVGVLGALGLSRPISESSWQLGPEANAYLLSDSPFFMESLVQNEDPMEGAVCSALQHEQPGAVASGLSDMVNVGSSVAEEYIALMHRTSLPHACKLGRQDVFRMLRNLLDVGGGSGALSIGIASMNPKIRCTILDLEPVCTIADGYIAEYGLQDRITTLSGNMLERVPSGYDGILLGNILHDWEWEVCAKLLQRCFQALDPGGFVCIHESLLDPPKHSPFEVVALSVTMLVHERGKQRTFQELRRLLAECGFEGIYTRPSSEHYSVVIGRKPAA